VYWIPAIFIFLEFVFIMSLDSMVKNINAKIIYERYKDPNLAKYIKENYKGTEILSAILAICYIGQIAYFIVGLFKPIWMISIVYILYLTISTIVDKVRKTPIEKTIKRAKLKGFEASDVKLDRLLKLNELKGSEIKTYEWMNYIYPLIRIIVFIGIIVLHYNFKVW
jgi:hypothetical protein